mmetsp:Transcript_22041/g.39509  ORF Transcript_22041/g.39509 Transcript_22041/m.39509 type:complete len:200 (-) Transcript_22041:37-636(-)|eukprot:CAMPEP_0197631116 /NCGR_PEP_ID=MMETSP1338-20131121/8392_1 /TAXON_ID=43686 ORGANISM="Pelagodinium beii, Strain RCC1491" /NCGR_SAMPLE_ID=MMETSP1338 /ASSEMBLY_ACC=CAM_ASM_000754 /LENGTH=199 /DNA_ID=CAMNT_0043202507 /DNA_START=47 /DNA_END=646 /DNA_ORIENTATION=-
MTKPLDMNKTPWNLMKTFEEATHKQNAAIEAFELRNGGPRRYRFQAPGERVELFGLTRQTHLNGLEGQLDFSNADEMGYLKVRMPKWARTTRAGPRRVALGETSGKEGIRYMKVQLKNLQPVRHPSDTRPRGGLLKEFCDWNKDDIVSIKSCTETEASYSRLSTTASLPELEPSRPPSSQKQMERASSSGSLRKSKQYM